MELVCDYFVCAYQLGVRGLFYSLRDSYQTSILVKASYDSSKYISVPQSFYVSPDVHLLFIKSGVFFS